MSTLARTSVYAVALMVAMTFSGTIALAKAGRNKHSRDDRSVRGTVTAADRNSITVETKRHGSQQFRLTPHTTVEKLGKHGAVKSSKASQTGSGGKARKARKIRAGSRVEVMAKDGVAVKVSVKRKHHKGKTQ